MNDHLHLPTAARIHMRLADGPAHRLEDRRARLRRLVSAFALTLLLAGAAATWGSLPGVGPLVSTRGETDPGDHTGKTERR